MKKLLVMVPSRGRPKRIKEFLESYTRTKSEGTDLVVYVNNDDPVLED